MYKEGENLVYDELVKALRNNADHYGFVGENAQLAFDAANAIETLEIIIDGLNTVVKELTNDVRPVTHGQWILVTKEHRGLKWGMHQCTACGKERPMSIFLDDGSCFNFCPNCGADMRGDSDV